MAYRRNRAFSFRLRFIENPISRTQSNCIILCRLSEFFKFIIDDEGKLKRYLFESNVRDYNGLTGVNQAISETLNNNLSPAELDFWWLNNGITIIASSANIAGKEISLENIQIVNGLQTTETIYRTFSAKKEIEDDRAVLIKILVTNDEEVRDKIIKATNSQTPVDIASLRATDKIQRDIEHIMQDYGWFYDRRKNFYRNQGKPQSQIVSISYMAAIIKSIILKNPHEGASQKTRFMRFDDQYNEVFNPKWDIRVFPAAFLFAEAIERIMVGNPQKFLRANPKGLMQRRMWLSFILACRKLNTVNYGANMVVTLGKTNISEDDVFEANVFWEKVRSGFAPKKTRKVQGSSLSLVDFLKEKINEDLTSKNESKSESELITKIPSD